MVRFPAISAGFEVSGKSWKAFVTTISARQLRHLYRKHKTDLFSANVRDYLGARHSDANINHGIRQTADSEPENFWAFNNGLTVLVNDYEASPPAAPRMLKVQGLSIVNGAQTTGGIADARLIVRSSENGGVLQGHAASRFARRCNHHRATEKSGAIIEIAQPRLSPTD